MTRQKVSLIKGDGIGPEICDAVLSVFGAAKIPIEWEEVEAGLGCIEKHGCGVSAVGLSTLRKNKIALKGPTTTPVGGGHASINVFLRNSLQLYANVRPSRITPGLKVPFSDVNLIIVRENLEDTYGGIENMLSPDYAQCQRIITRSGSLRIHRYAFEMARREGRKKVTCGHKANIMKLTDGLFLETFREVAKDFPDLQSDDIIIDNCCMQLVRKPSQFDVLVLPNLFGDIVSDLCAGLVGGLGVASGANIGHDCAIFEAVHGSAPDIAGKGLANPTAILCSAVSMLRHMSLKVDADRVDAALLRALAKPETRTKDLGGTCNTQEFTAAIIKELGRA